MRIGVVADLFPVVMEKLPVYPRFSVFPDPPLEQRQVLPVLFIPAVHFKGQVFLLSTILLRRIPPGVNLTQCLQQFRRPVVQVIKNRKVLNARKRRLSLRVRNQIPQSDLLSGQCRCQVFQNRNTFIIRTEQGNRQVLQFPGIPFRFQRQAELLHGRIIIRNADPVQFIQLTDHSGQVPGGVIPASDPGNKRLLHEVTPGFENMGKGQVDIPDVRFFLLPDQFAPDFIDRKILFSSPGIPDPDCSVCKEKLGKGPVQVLIVPVFRLVRSLIQTEIERVILRQDIRSHQLLQGVNPALFPVIVPPGAPFQPPLLCGFRLCEQGGSEQMMVPFPQNPAVRVGHAPANACDADVKTQVVFPTHPHHRLPAADHRSPSIRFPTYPSGSGP